MALEIIERIYSGHWFLSSYNGLGFVRDFPRMGGGRFITKVIFVMQNGMCRYIFDSDEFEKAAHFTADRLINDSRWRLGLYKKIDAYTEKYFKAGESFKALSLDSLSDDEIAKEVEKMTALQKNHQVLSVLANGVVLDGRNHFSDKIREELRNLLKNPKDFDDHWSLLTQVTKMSLRQRKDYEIALLAKRSRSMEPGEVDKVLHELHGKYCWLDYNNTGPQATFEEFKDQLEASVKSNVSLDMPLQLKGIKMKQERLMKKLGFNKRARFLIQLAQHVIWQKGYRKDMQYHGFYCYENLFREIARRNGMEDWKVFGYLFPWEVRKFLESRTPSIGELIERRNFSCIIIGKDRFDIKVGKEARELVGNLNLMEDFSHLKETKGQCAYAGKITGRAKIVQVPADMAKMEKGDILISQATSPDLLLAMKKAGAIVTNTGGLICHAAITSRELKIPCVVGTQNATLIFKDGDMIEVDATKGIVKKL